MHTWSMRCTYSLAHSFTNFSSTIALLLTLFIVGSPIRFEPVVVICYDYNVQQ